jgi:hypothetical protein
MRQPNDETIAAPEFYILIGNQPPGLLGRFCIVGAGDPFEFHEMSVVPDKIYPILGHLKSPPAVDRVPSNVIREQVAMALR